MVITSRLSSYAAIVRSSVVFLLILRILPQCRLRCFGSSSCRHLHSFCISYHHHHTFVTCIRLITMATHAAMPAQDPFPRSTTPRPRPSSVRIITKRSSYQSLMSPALMNPTSNLPFSPISPDWPAIKLLSPSTASHHSVISDQDETSEIRSPRLALLTSGLGDECDELNKLISPSAPVPQPGDELLYDVLNEEMTDMAFFNPEFQSALARTKQEMNDISLALWGYPGSHQLGSHLHALKQRAQQLGEFEPMRTRRIAVVGGSGAGKLGLVCFRGCC
jgi:hypothetical protein